MKKIISFLRHSHPEIYKGFLFVLAATIIIYVYPKQGKFKYDFRNLKGKPWHQEDLIAPFDFAIKKSTQELADEKSTILKNSKLYFKTNNDVIDTKKAQLKSAFDNGWNNDSKFSKALNLAFATQVLNTIYTKGVIAPNDVIENKPSDFSIVVLNNNIAEEHDLPYFYTIKTAADFIQQSILLQNKNKINIDFILPILQNSISHSIFYDPLTTNKLINQALGQVSPTRDIVLKDQRIVARGEIVDANKYQILESLKAEYESQSGGMRTYQFILLGQIIVVIVCLSILIGFLTFFRKDIFVDNTKITFILLLIILQVLMSRISLSSNSLSIYILPFCILPIIIRAFFDTRVALFVHLVSILLISFMVPNRFDFLFIELLGGMVAILSIVSMRNRSQIFISTVLIFITYSLSFTGITVIQEGGNDLLSWGDFMAFGISALLTLFSYPLIFIFEKLFGYISDVSLLELSDTNGKLLRELASVAPGTFQHSLQVANLAEEATHTIGGNPLLVRAGSLYHDIGKMENPLYFIENQTNGINPHEDLNFDESAGIIINHVIKGIEIAKKHKLPEQIIDFIRTHHGTTVTGFFYRSYKNSFPNEDIDESKFHYPGPIPFSKETAVLMIADSVEAASRSLKKYDAETIDNLVNSIIDGQIEQNQFANADITFKDINTLKHIFKKKLMTIYHVRVEYPR